jgi:hypothetical protein
MSGFHHDFFEASSIDELLGKIEINPKFAWANNVPHVRDHASKIMLGAGSIATPNKHGDLSDEEFCNRWVAEFHREWAVLTAPAERVFFRWTNREDETDLSRDRTIRPSVNHRTGKTELGLSVAAGPRHCYLIHDFCYFLAGEDIGPDSDGEPVLDIATLEVRRKGGRCFATSTSEIVR